MSNEAGSAEFTSWVVLALAAILTIGSRTVCNLLRTLGTLAPGHESSYQRVFSKRCWSPWRLAQRLAGWVFDHLAPSGPIFLAGDDTVDEHPGDKVFGKGCHRDPVRSTHRFTAFRCGHKWVVVSVLVRFPFTRFRSRTVRIISTPTSMTTISTSSSTADAPWSRTMDGKASGMRTPMKIRHMA